MLGQRDPQATIFDGDQLYLEHVGERTLYGYLARHRHELFHDEDFAALYDAKLGRPTTFAEDPVLAKPDSVGPAPVRLGAQCVRSGRFRTAATCAPGPRHAHGRSR